MKKKSILCALTALSLILSTGCGHLEYVGRHFDEHPEGAPIVFTWEKSEIDPAQYMIIGHGILTVSAHTDRYGIEDELVEEARKRGADAVCVVNSRRVEAGLYDLDEDEKSFMQGLTSDAGLMKPVEVPQEEDKKWGARTTLQGEYHGRKLVKVRAVFWKNRKEAEPLIRQQKELLEHKAAGNWNGENVPDMPKKEAEKELIPQNAPQSEEVSIPLTTTEPTPLPIPPSGAPRMGRDRKSSDTESTRKNEPTEQYGTSPNQPHMPLPPSGIVAMP